MWTEAQREKMAIQVTDCIRASAIFAKNISMEGWKLPVVKQERSQLKEIYCENISWLTPGLFVLKVIWYVLLPILLYFHD